MLEAAAVSWPCLPQLFPFCTLESTQHFPHELQGLMAGPVRVWQLGARGWPVLSRVTWRTRAVCIFENEEQWLWVTDISSGNWFFFHLFVCFFNARKGFTMKPTLRWKWPPWCCLFWSPSSRPGNSTSTHGGQCDEAHTWNPSQSGRFTLHLEKTL